MKKNKCLIIICLMIFALSLSACGRSQSKAGEGDGSPVASNPSGSSSSNNSSAASRIPIAANAKVSLLHSNSAQAGRAADAEGASPAGAAGTSSGAEATGRTTTPDSAGPSGGAAASESAGTAEGRAATEQTNATGGESTAGGAGADSSAQTGPGEPAEQAGDETAPGGSVSVDPADQKENGSADAGSIPGGSVATDPLISWMQKGTYRFDFRMITEVAGVKSEAAGSVAMEGGNVALSVDMLGDGVMVHFLLIEDVVYLVEHTSKVIMRVPGIDMAMLGLVPDLGEARITDTGTGEINGRALPFEEYESEGGGVRIFFDGGSIYGFSMGYEEIKITMIVENATDRIPPGTFAFPAGYTTM